jgi:hypothetical protein
MPLTAQRRAEGAFREAWISGCLIGDCEQAYWLAYDGIEPAPQDDDFTPLLDDHTDCVTEPSASLC